MRRRDFFKVVAGALTGGEFLRTLLKKKEPEFPEYPNWENKTFTYKKPNPYALVSTQKGDNYLDIQNHYWAKRMAARNKILKDCGF